MGLYFELLYRRNETARRDEDSLSNVPGEEESITPLASETCEKPELSDADILSLIDDLA